MTPPVPTARAPLPALEGLRLHLDGAILWVELNRPEVHNAFDLATISSLQAVFADPLGHCGLTPADADALRGLVLCAQGSVFCAGADLQWMRSAAQADFARNESEALALSHMLWLLSQCPWPVVAKVQGDCYGGALGLLACADIVLSADHAQFCFSEVKLGLIPATIAPYAVRAMGERAARRLFLTAERFSAHEARALQLVHETMPLAALSDRLAQVLSQLRRNAPQATRACKQWLHDLSLAPAGTDWRAASAKRIAEVRSGAEARDGLDAFLTRHAPAWLLPDPPTPTESH